MKKRLIAAVAAASLWSGFAVAADLDLQTKVPHRGCGGGAFQGIFVGVHGGGVNHTATRWSPRAPAPASWRTTC
jgi:hypothetical protein